MPLDALAPQRTRRGTLSSPTAPITGHMQACLRWIPVAPLDSHGWVLESAVERHVAYPETFEIPPAEVRNNLQIGQGAKLLFRLKRPEDEGVERMWVTVTRITDTGYVGALESKPVGCQVLAPGDRVSFTADHVADAQDYAAGVVGRMGRRLARLARRFT